MRPGSQSPPNDNQPGTPSAGVGAVKRIREGSPQFRQFLVGVGYPPDAKCRGGPAMSIVRRTRRDGAKSPFSVAK